MGKSTVWISFDLGVRGDYGNFYNWLDEHGAKECGDTLAVFEFSYQGKLLEALKRDIDQRIHSDKRTRVYVIYREAKTKKMKGSFIFGGRRVPPWTGYSQRSQDDTDEAV
jgi:hypothetical protein